MYTEDHLRKYRYFAELLETKELEQITDSLTGAVSRKYILDFARSLMTDNIPFTFGMVDLDNFKFINDTYGHRAGDGVLSGVASGLSEYMKDFGVVGRFGGDELMFVDLADITYDEKKSRLADIYMNSKILRWNYDLGDCSPFITGTVGCATFPDDSGDYDELFSMIDKTLYRGKSKGRNCYIIYVKEKHKDIEIKKLACHSYSMIAQSMIRRFELVPGTKNRLRSVLPLLINELGITRLYFTDSSGIMHSVLDDKFLEDVSDLNVIMIDDIYSTNDIDHFAGQSPLFYKALRKHKMETILVARIGRMQDTDGYLICAEPRTHRIWQDDERLLIYFLAKLIASGIRIDGDIIPT
ncbi:MAG: GGDEF domain-containing protein [Ruminiclostridium sp.]|nr:GGDEF domain-containing protein [Ruminiclostridium sp.]